MTDKEKGQIRKYREEGFSYAQISKMMDLSLNSIKAYCQRHNLGVRGTCVAKKKEEDRCEYCKVILDQKSGRKKKRFCSDKCRMRWWNSHPEQVKRKANYEFQCLHCKKEFVAYGNASRKFCSHSCYIEYRFGGMN